MSTSKPAKRSSRNRFLRGIRPRSRNISTRSTMTPPQAPSPDRGSSFRLAALAAFVAIVFAGYYLLWTPSRTSLVVYCAHDSIYADQILRDFERQTGIPVAVRYDTEATKSLGLVELHLREKAHPPCDVFWKNELLGTLQLADEGLLLPYRGSG